MRIRAFHLDSFGHLRDLSLQDIPAGFTVFLGRNEVGKSTLLDFFRCMLTGYPGKARDARERMRAAGGRENGGSLLLDTAQGTIRLTRRPGANGGVLALSNAAGDSLDAAVWDRLLAGVTREVYASVYGFSLSELQTFGSLTSEAVRHALYGASFGMGLRSPGAALKRLEAVMEPLFKPGGSRPALSAALRDWEDTRKAVRAEEETVARYDALAAEAAAARAALARAQDERGVLEKERRALERRLGVWRQWEEWRLIGVRLDRLEVPPATFPEDGPARLERALERRESAAREAALAAERVERVAQELAAATVDETVLAAGERLEELAERKSSCRNALMAIPGLHSSLDRLEADIARELGRLGPDWSLERVLGAERSLALREAAENAADRLRSALAAHETARTGLARCARELDEARAAVDEARCACERLPAPVQELAETDRDELRRCLERAAEARRRLPEREKALDSARLEFNRALTHLCLPPRQSTAEALEALSAAQEDARDLSTRTLTLIASANEAKRLAGQAADEERRARERLDRLRGEREALGEPNRATVDARRRKLRALREGIIRLSAEESRRTETEERLSAHLADSPGADRSIALMGMGGVLGLAGAAALVGRYVFGLTSLDLSPDLTVPLESWIGYLVFLSGVAFIGAGAPRGRPEAARHAALAGQLRARLAAADRKVQESRDEIMALSVALGLNPPDATAEEAVRAALLDSLEAELDQEREQCVAGERLDRAVADYAGEVEALHQRSRNLEAEHAQLAVEVQASRRRWHERLMDLGVQRVPLPEEASAFFARVDSARMLWSGVAALEKEVADLEAGLAGLTQAVNRLLPDSAWMAGADIQENDLDATLAAASRVLESCRQADLAAEERSRAAEALRSAEARMDRAEQAEAEAAEQVREAEQHLSAARENWGTHLHGLGLERDLSPSTAREALESMDRIASLAVERNRCQDELGRQERERDALLHPLRSLLEELGRAPAEADAEATDWLSMLDAVRRAYENARATAATRTVLLSRRVELEESSRQAAAVLADAERSVDWLLRMAEATDPEDFLRRHALRCERETLTRRAEELEDALRVAAADIARMEGIARASEAPADDAAALPDDASFDERIFQTFLHGFAETEEEERTDRLKEVCDRLAVLTDEENRLDNAARNAELQVAALAGSDRLADLRRQEAALEERIHALALEWSRHALARQLIVDAKNHFERERQPEVIRIASTLFAAITNGRWQGVSASLEDSSLRVIPPQGPAVSPEILSRGTREQLYLALRLAHIRSHAAQAAPLPVIMDDILVNFDPERADRAADAIASLCGPTNAARNAAQEEASAPGHQVLFFTCHPHTAEKLGERIPGCALFGMENGLIRALG